MVNVKRLLHKHGQLFIGLIVGALIMLPTGLYINERVTNNNRVTPSVPINTNGTGLQPVTSPSSKQVEATTTPTLQPSTTSTNKAPNAVVPADKCNYTAMNAADSKYDNALLVNVQEYNQKLASITAEINNPTTSTERLNELLVIQKDASAKKLEVDNIIWNTHVTELAKAGCSRGQSYR